MLKLVEALCADGTPGGWLLPTLSATRRSCPVLRIALEQLDS